MTDKYDQDEKMDEVVETAAETTDQEENGKEDSDKGGDYEDVCFVCRRPEQGGEDVQASQQYLCL